MSIGNTKDQGNKGNNFPFQLKTLQLLSAINDSINALPGVDYETRTSTYQATCTICGPGYSTGDIIVRYDIIDVATQTLAAEMWFNQTTQGVISPAPAPGNLTPISAPSGVTVLNGPLGAAVNIQDGGNSITVDANDLDIRDLVFATDSVDVSGSSVSISNLPLTQDVNIISSITLNVQATSLDIRPLDCATDEVAICSDGNPVGALNPLPVSASILFPSSLPVTQDPSSDPWIVSATALDIRSLTFLTDSVDVSNSNVNAVVTATDLDIRNLTFVDDKVDVSGSNINATQSGSWNVGITGTVPLPTGAATEATLSTISGTASSILSGLSSLNQETTQLLIKAKTDNLDIQLSTRATETTLQSVVDNVTSKIERIKGAANYSRVFTYYAGTNNVEKITHTGTTLLGIPTETIIETFQYVNNSVDGSNVIDIIYS